MIQSVHMIRCINQPSNPTSSHTSYLFMSSCSHSDSISRRGNAPEFGKAIASCTGRKARLASGRSSSRPKAQAMTPDKAIVKLPATTSCHESRRAAGFNVAPVLDIISAGRKSSVQIRLALRHDSLVSRAAPA